MKLSDFENEEALDLIADIMEPSAAIFSDGIIRDAVRAGKTKVEIARLAIKEHKKPILEIFARLDNTPVDEYKCNVATVITNLLEILNDPIFKDFFISQEPMMANVFSTQPMENTEVKKK